SEFLARFGDRGWVRFAEQVVRVLARALAGGALRRLDLCRRGRFWLCKRAGGKKRAPAGADRAEGLRAPGKGPPPSARLRAHRPTLLFPSIPSRHHRPRRRTNFTGSGDAVGSSVPGIQSQRGPEPALRTRRPRECLRTSRYTRLRYSGL